MKIINCKIDVSKIDKSKLYKGEKGTYLNCTLIESTNDKYDNDFMIVQDVTKEEREQKIKGTILGNGKIYKPKEEPEDLNVKKDDLPF